MDLNEIKKLLDESNQQFADALKRCRGGSVYDPRLAAPAVSKIEKIFLEILELEEQLFCDLERAEDS